MTMYCQPPDDLVIDGIPYKIDTDFRVWIDFYSIFTTINDNQARANAVISFLEQQSLPLTLSSMDAVLQFFSGNDRQNTKQKKGKRHKAVDQPCIDFQKDSEYIISAFWQVYGVDLTSENLHWHKFLALFRGLPENCQMCRIMQYRAIDIKDVPKSQQKFYRKMKRLYSLNSEQQFDGAEERAADMKQRAQEAYLAAKDKLALEDKQA